MLILITYKSLLEFSTSIPNANQSQKIAKCCIDAVELVNTSKTGTITGIKIYQYSKKCGEICQLINGFIIEKEIFGSSLHSSRVLDHPKILFLQYSIDLDPVQLQTIKRLGAQFIITTAGVNPNCVLWLAQQSIIILQCIPHVSLIDLNFEGNNC